MVVLKMKQTLNYNLLLSPLRVRLRATVRRSINIMRAIRKKRQRIDTKDEVNKIRSNIFTMSNSKKSNIEIFEKQGQKVVHNNKS